jgi:hypothetical protein
MHALLVLHAAKLEGCTEGIVRLVADNPTLYAAC